MSKVSFPSLLVLHVSGRIMEMVRWVQETPTTPRLVVSFPGHSWYLRKSRVFISAPCPHGTGMKIHHGGQRNWRDEPDDVGLLCPACPWHKECPKVPTYPAVGAQSLRDRKWTGTHLGVVRVCTYEEFMNRVKARTTVSRSKPASSSKWLVRT